MIKLVCFIHRRPDVERAEFHRYWREVHGPLIASLPELARHVVRYEQNHRLESDYARDTYARYGDGEPAEFDGSTIMSFDSMAAYEAFANEPLYAEQIAPDEARFMDRARTLFFFTDEAETKLGGPREQAEAKLKLMALLRRKPGLPIEDFHAHWSGPHGDLFRDTPALRDRILAYHQSHRPAADYERDPATEWDGLAEQWYRSLEEFEAGAGGPPFEQIIVPDEERFIDRPATRFLLCEPPDVILP